MNAATETETDPMAMAMRSKGSKSNVPDLSAASRKLRPFKSRCRSSKNWRNLETVKTLAGKLGQSGLSVSTASNAASAPAACAPTPVSNSTGSSLASVSMTSLASVSASHEKLCAVASRDSSVVAVAVAVSSGGAPHKNAKKAQTVGAQFQHSLQSLMVALNNANPFFVRCVKSNRLKVYFVD